MKKIILLGLLVATLAACSHMDGVVKEVRVNKNGDLVITKCDEKIIWNALFIIGSETNCREEVKPRPVLPAS